MIAKVLIKSQFAPTALGWVEVAIGAVSLFLIPTVLRLRVMHSILGWWCLAAFVITIVLGPIVPAQAGPWISYLVAIGVSGAGAYLFLIDKGVARYRSLLQAGGARGEQQAGRGESGDGLSEPLSSVPCNKP
jgi:hypothetical protein